MIKRYACKRLKYLCILLFYTASSQGQHFEGSGNNAPYSDEFIREKIRENTISGEFDKSVIPANKYYLQIFRDILFDPPAYLTQSDWEIVQRLPSHLDLRVFEGNVVELENICKDAKALVSDDDALDIALRIDAARKTKELLLDEHYQKVLSALSEETRRRIQEVFTDLHETDRLGYATLDMKGLAIALPGMARKMAERGCENVTLQLEIQRQIQGDEGYLLIDELQKHGTPMLESDIRRD